MRTALAKHNIITSLIFYDFVPEGTNNRKPLAGAPISLTSQTLQTVPLYLLWYLLPSNGHDTLAEPEYIGVYDAAQMSNSANWS